MLTLIRKDIRLHKTALLGFAPVLVVFLGWIASEMKSQYVFITFTCIYAALLPMVLIAREGKFGAEAFICSLPVTRRQVARAKFVLSWILALLFAVVGLVLYSAFGPGDPLAIWNASTVGRLLITLTVGLGAGLPLLMRFGWMGLMVGLVGAQILGILALLVIKTFGPRLHLGAAIEACSEFLDGMHAQLGSPLFLAVVIVTAAIANWISLQVGVMLFQRREF